MVILQFSWVPFGGQKRPDWNVSGLGSSSFTIHGVPFWEQKISDWNASGLGSGSFTIRRSGARGTEETRLECAARPLWTPVHCKPLGEGLFQFQQEVTFPSPCTSVININKDLMPEKHPASPPHTHTYSHPIYLQPNKAEEIILKTSKKNFFYFIIVKRQKTNV